MSQPSGDLANENENKISANQLLKIVLKGHVIVSLFDIICYFLLLLNVL